MSNKVLELQEENLRLRSVIEGLSMDNVVLTHLLAQQPQRERVIEEFVKPGSRRVVNERIVSGRNGCKLKTTLSGT